MTKWCTKINLKKIHSGGNRKLVITGIHKYTQSRKIYSTNKNISICFWPKQNTTSDRFFFKITISMFIRMLRVLNQKWLDIHSA